MQLPVENPKKYGSWEADADEFAAILRNNNAGATDRPGSGRDTASQDADEVDADFLRNAGHSDSHYGKG
jgi:hypothetical protein